jgi:hypothetical protein
MSLENADSTSGPGPWFTARYGGDCASCGDPFDEGDTIRADGEGGWECTGCDEAGHPNRREPFTGTSFEEMGL